MEDEKRKARFALRLKRKSLPGARKRGMMRVRMAQLKLRRAMRLHRKLGEGVLKRSESLTTQEHWRSALHWYKLKKTNWTAR